MQISDEMMAKALAIAPSMNETAVRRMLEAALAGPIVFAHEQGARLSDGKPTFPDYLQIEFSSAEQALRTIDALRLAAHSQREGSAQGGPVALMLVGRTTVVNET